MLLFKETLQLLNKVVGPYVMEGFVSGHFVKQGSYKSFQPEKINQAWKVEDMELLSLLSQADRQLGRLDMYSEYVPNIDLFITMHVLKEATQSSKIEGTKTNIEEALLNREDLAEEKRDDWEEVQHYIQALNEAIEKLNELPFSSRLIRETHKTLLSGVRGRHKSPGELRSSQNWIGGSSISDATFVPPVHTTIHEYMSDLERFVHNEALFFPELLKIALIHYQFETIHPFLDGNGRVGRLMITLYLVEKNILKKPILYLSDFFERNRQLYYDNLMIVRTKHDITRWYKFFLTGIIETAKNSIETFDKILKLQQEVENSIQTLGSRARNAALIIRYLYKHPILDYQMAKSQTGMSAPSVYRLLGDLESMGILREITGGRRGKLFLFSDYIDLFR